MPEFHRTVVFGVHQPTRRVRVVLEDAFQQYTLAYTELLHTASRVDRQTLHALATYTPAPREGRTSVPRLNARALMGSLYTLPDMARTLAGVGAPLPSRLRQSVREHVAQTLTSYLALTDAHTEDPTLGGLPTSPTRVRADHQAAQHQHALRELAQIADHGRREGRLVAQLLQTRQRATVAIPFVGVNSAYGCGLYRQQETGHYYARLDVIGSHSHHARPISIRGHFTDLKTGLVWVRQEDAQEPGVESFGRGTGSLLVPLALSQHHLSPRRFSPQAVRRRGGAGMLEGTPVSARLVRRIRADGEIAYELHVAFAFEVPSVPTQTDRPLLAINRGLHHLYTAVRTTPTASERLETFAASGEPLRALQEALERQRRQRAMRGVSSGGTGVTRPRDRRQRRIAADEIARCANQIAAHAQRCGAQVVLEDLSAFASGHALRRVQAPPRRRTAALRALLNRRQFEALHQALDLRLEECGLPPARVVQAAFISQTCLQCGHRAAENVMPEDPRTFRCQRCGFQHDRDLVAAANVARRFAFLLHRGAQNAAGLAEDARTPWEEYAVSHPIG